MCIVVAVIEGLGAWFAFDLLNDFSVASDPVFLPRDFLIIWIVLVIIMSLPVLVAGLALLRLQPWSRTFGTIVLTCGMLSFPFGTALGLYGLLLLTSAEVDEVFSPRFSRVTK